VYVFLVLHHADHLDKLPLNEQLLLLTYLLAYLLSGEAVTEQCPRPSYIRSEYLSTIPFFSSIHFPTHSFGTVAVPLQQ